MNTGKPTRSSWHFVQAALFLSQLTPANLWHLGPGHGFLLPWRLATLADDLSWDQGTRAIALKSLGLGFRVEAFGLTVLGSGLSGQGLGFGVYGLE